LASLNKRLAKVTSRDSLREISKGVMVGNNLTPFVFVADQSAAYRSSKQSFKFQSVRENPDRWFDDFTELQLSALAGLATLPLSVLCRAGSQVSANWN